MSDEAVSKGHQMLGRSSLALTHPALTALVTPTSCHDKMDHSRRDPPSATAVCWGPDLGIPHTELCDLDFCSAKSAHATTCSIRRGPSICDGRKSARVAQLDVRNQKIGVPAILNGPRRSRPGRLMYSRSDAVVDKPVTLWASSRRGRS